jgi:Bacterial protein of unknown function (HtrL_YibB)
MIVTAYFQIPSKQSHEFYIPHLERFLEWVESPIVFFTSRDLVDEMRSLRPSHLPIQFVLYDSVYEIESYKKYGRDFWNHQSTLADARHQTPELGAIWYNKKEFVNRAIELTNLDEPYIWTDAGCIRQDYWKLFAPTFGKNHDAIPINKIMIQLMESEISKDIEFFKFENIYVAGAIIAGYKEAWKRYSKIYDEVFLEYLSQGLCVSSDQSVIARLCVKNPDIVETVYDGNLHPAIDRWFFFLKLLSTVHTGY